MNFALDAILTSYSCIFFSTSRLLGTFILAATLTGPIHGLFGLMGGIFASAVAYLAGMNRDAVRGGIYGFNGILTGLALGYFFEPTATMIVYLLGVSILLTFVTVAMNDVFYRLFGLPAMSMPLNLVAWLALGAASALGYLSPSGARWHLVNIPIDMLPESMGYFFSALASVLFQVNVATGIVIAVGLIIWSRIALVLMAIGYIASFAMQTFLGIDPTPLGGYSLAFNHMFAALAVGGIFTVPTPGSLILAIIAALTSTIILTAIQPLFPLGISPLVLPFNIAVMLVLYTLKIRTHATLNITLAPEPHGSPEDNLSHLRENIRVWRRWKSPLSLPFIGRWQVSQGIDGKLTHRGDWRFAYDFMAVGPDGASYRGGGVHVEDYYGFGLPVLAPSDGVVISSVDNVEDNEIGKVNPSANWGNTVVIEHAPGYYSCIAHLKKGSSLVKPGVSVSRGQQIAQCGNSGHSPYPHLHIQMQLSPLVGSPTIPFEFSNIMVVRGSQESFVSKGGLKDGGLAGNAHPIAEASDYFPSEIGRTSSYHFSQGVLTKIDQESPPEEMTTDRKGFEMWVTNVDFYGNTFIESSPTMTRLYFLMANGLLTLKKLEGSRSTGLYYFGSSISEIPFVDGTGGISWESNESADYILHPLVTKLVDLLSIMGVSMRIRIAAKASSTDNDYTVTIGSRLVVTTPFGSLPVRRLDKETIVFSKGSGLENVSRH